MIIITKKQLQENVANIKIQYSGKGNKRWKNENKKLTVIKYFHKMKTLKKEIKSNTLAPILLKIKLDYTVINLQRQDQ